MPQNNASIAYQFFVDQGLTTHQAAGIVGNLMQESGSQLDPKAVGDKGTAFGIAQWREDRHRALQNFARVQGGDWKDLTVQLNFLKHEATQDGTWAKVQQTKTVEDATAAFIGFERPRGWTAENPKGGDAWDRRLSFAETLAGSSGGTTAYTGTMPSKGGEPTLADTLGSDLGMPDMPGAPEPVEKKNTLWGQLFSSTQPKPLFSTMEPLPAPPPVPVELEKSPQPQFRPRAPVVTPGLQSDQLTKLRADLDELTKGI